MACCGRRSVECWQVIAAFYDRHTIAFVQSELDQVPRNKQTGPRRAGTISGGRCSVHAMHRPPSYCNYHSLCCIRPILVHNVGLYRSYKSWKLQWGVSLTRPPYRTHECACVFPHLPFFLPPLRSGERCKLPQRGLDVCKDVIFCENATKSISVHSALKSDIW